MDIQGAKSDIGTRIGIWSKNVPLTVIANQKWKVYEKECDCVTIEWSIKLQCHDIVYVMYNNNNYS